MNFRPMPPRAAAGLCLIAFAGVGRAQGPPAQRIANIVNVAVSEYAKGVDARGQLIAADEYQETLGFLADARRVAERLPSQKVATVALLDTIIAAVKAKQSPADVSALEKRFAAS